MYPEGSNQLYHMWKSWKKCGKRIMLCDQNAIKKICMKLADGIVWSKIKESFQEPALEDSVRPQSLKPSVIWDGLHNTW